MVRGDRQAEHCGGGTWVEMSEGLSHVDHPGQFIHD